MHRITYPGLYYAADSASNKQQKLYLTLVKAEFAALFLASVLTIDIAPRANYIIIYGIVLGTAAALLAVRSVFKLEQGWYQARALAESVKTATWKYVMRAKPFEAADHAVVREQFRQFLRDILTANRQIGSQFDGSAVTKDQITPVMEAIRSLPLDERLAVYMDQRVENQCGWYAKKAKTNRNWAIGSISALATLYAAAFALLLIRIKQPEWVFSHPEPLILVATALIGWMQIKKFNELSTSYKLTAVEIGILKSQAPEIGTDLGLSNFVDDAEEAFSREHTQWVARRSHPD